MNNLDRIFQNSDTPKDFARSYLDYLSQVLSQMDENAIGLMLTEFIQARNEGRHIFFIGNGGSAATASHFANDIAIGTRTQTKPFKAISLTDNVAILTALGNDDGYESIFVRQLQTLSQQGDVLVAISASGNSPNIIKAVEFAKAASLTTIGLTGFEGGQLKEMADISVHVPTPNGEYGPVEDVHMVMDHLIGSYLNRLVKQTE